MAAAAAVVSAAPGVRSRWEGGAGRREAVGAGGAASTLRRLNWKATPPARPSATSCPAIGRIGDWVSGMALHIPAIMQEAADGAEASAAPSG